MKRNIKKILELYILENFKIFVSLKYIFFYFCKSGIKYMYHLNENVLYRDEIILKVSY